MESRACAPRRGRSELWRSPQRVVRGPEEAEAEESKGDQEVSLFGGFQRNPKQKDPPPKSNLEKDDMGLSLPTAV